MQTDVPIRERVAELLNASVVLERSEIEALQAVDCRDTLSDWIEVISGNMEHVDVSQPLKSVGQ